MSHDEFSFEPDIQQTGARGTSVPAVFDESARTALAIQMLKHMQTSLAHLVQLLEDGDVARAQRNLVHVVIGKKALEQSFEQQTGAHWMEGVFDGAYFHAQDGSRHLVPENYASKSKLVEGDMLKLMVLPDGRHVFKQIAPVERKRMVGVLGVDGVTNSPVVMVGEDVYKVLSASVSYFKGVTGDEVVILIPGSGKSVWAALERIVGK